MYLLWIVSIIWLLRTLKIYLEDDPFDLRPIRERDKEKEKVKSPKKCCTNPKRHHDKVNLDEVKKLKKAKKLQ